MHVLVIPASYPTSDCPARGCFYREQALALHRHGLRMGVVAPMFRSLRQLFQRRRRRTLGWREFDDEGVATLSCERWARFSQLPSLHARDWVHTGQRLFARYVERQGLPNLIHAHGSIMAGRLARLIKRRTGIPFVVTEHNTIFSRHALRPWQDSQVHKTLTHAAARIAVSSALGELLENRYGNVARPWSWIPNMVSPSFQLKLPSRPGPGRDSKFRFLNVGLLTANKGQDILLHALAELSRVEANVELRIVGDGVLRNRLQHLAVDLGIASRVKFLGILDRPNVVNEMQSADAFVLSSRHETFGVVLIESLACGLPVIATRCGGPECIVETEDGLLVPPDDSHSLTIAMRQMLVQRSGYSSTVLRERCLARFGEAAVARQIAEVYERVLATQPRVRKEQAA